LKKAYIFTFLLSASLLTACGNSVVEAKVTTLPASIKEATSEPKATTSPSPEVTIAPSEIPVQENAEHTDEVIVDAEIDTSVFAFAQSVDITDARDTNKHIDLVVNMSEEITPALATQHVFLQTYNFLQQKDIKGADTITIGVMNGKFRVTQITVDCKKFVAGENLLTSVMAASKIDKMDDVVVQFGKETGFW
jgi:hypothetical protein